MTDKDSADKYTGEIAEKVNFLFDHFRRPDGKPFSYIDVEHATGGLVDNSWISKLANGKATRPGLGVLKALTQFFGVDPGFWFNDLDEWIKEQEETQPNSTPWERSFALRVRNLSPEQQLVVEDIVGSFEKRFKSTSGKNQEN